MSNLGKPWLRGALTLGVLTIFGAAALISSAGAVPENKEASKKFVKKRINKLGPAIANAAVQNDNNTAEGIFASFEDGGGGVPDTMTTIGTLDLPAGAYAIFAKIVIFDSADEIRTDCQLVVGGDRDDAYVYMDPTSGASPFASQTLTMMVVSTLNTNSTVQVRCLDAGNVDNWDWLKIIALRQPTLSNVPASDIIDRDS